MRKKRVMVVGPTQCGKTSLVRLLEQDGKPVRRTPDMIYGKVTMDCPGSYVENADSYKHLIAASQDASHVLLLVDQSRPIDIYSPRFAQAFTKPVVGVITKTDLKPENRESCLRQLKLMGVDGPIFPISVKTGEGINELKDYLFGSAVDK
ncbi:MAG: EutP/PduV family microcompartment system protein [Clostridia bacterium]|nr:EutP/PduV family microcompartment system protein [Clostridia bacterium]